MPWQKLHKAYKTITAIVETNTWQSPFRLIYLLSIAENSFAAVATYRISSTAPLEIKFQHFVTGFVI